MEIIENYSLEELEDLKSELQQRILDSTSYDPNYQIEWLRINKIVDEITERLQWRN